MSNSREGVQRTAVQGYNGAAVQRDQVCMAFNTHEDVELPAELTDLTSLTYLGLTTGDSEEEEKVCIDVHVN